MFPLEHINFSQTFDTPYTYIIYDIVYITTYKQTVTNTQRSNLNWKTPSLFPFELQRATQIQFSFELKMVLVLG